MALYEYYDLAFRGRTAALTKVTSMSRTGVSVLAFAVAAVLAGPALGADDAPPQPRGYLTAFACDTLSSPLQLRVEVMDNTSQNLKLKDILVQRLEKNGATIVDSSPQVLSLEVAVARQATRNRPGDMVDVRVGGERPEEGTSDYARVRMNIWSSTRDSLLTGRQPGVEEEGFDTLRLRASLNSRSDGRCLWQGEIVENLDGEDAYGAAAKLIPRLADAVGQAVNRKPIN